MFCKLKWCKNIVNIHNLFYSWISCSVGFIYIDGVTLDLMCSSDMHANRTFRLLNPDCVISFSVLKWLPWPKNYIRLHSFRNTDSAISWNMFFINKICTNTIYLNLFLSLSAELLSQYLKIYNKLPTF